MKRHLNRWFELDFDGVSRRAKCIDIEFEGGLGPLFLMRTIRGKLFWLTRQELKTYEKVSKPMV